MGYEAVVLVQLKVDAVFVGPFLPSLLNPYLSHNENIATTSQRFG